MPPGTSPLSTEPPSYLLSSDEVGDGVESAPPGLALVEPPHLPVEVLVEALEAQKKAFERLPAEQRADPRAHYRLFEADPQRMARPLIEMFYRAYGTELVKMSSLDHLENEVALAMNWTPSQKLSGQTPAQLHDELRGGSLFQLNEKQQEVRDRIVEKIFLAGGRTPEVSVVPVVYALDAEGDHGGIRQTPLFKVRDADGSFCYIDEQGLDYDSIDEYRHWNGMPRVGVKLVMPEDGEVRFDERGRISLFAGDARIEGDVEWLRRVTYADKVALATGVLVGTGLVLSSAGILSLPGGWLAAGSGAALVAGAAGTGASLYGLAVTGSSLYQRARFGGDWTSRQAALEVGSLALGAAGLAQLATLGRAGALAGVAGSEADLAVKATQAGSAAIAAQHEATRAALMVQAQQLVAMAGSKPLNVTLGSGNLVMLGGSGYGLTQDWPHLSTLEKLERAVALVPGALSFGLNLRAPNMTLARPAEESASVPPVTAGLAETSAVPSVAQAAAPVQQPSAAPAATVAPQPSTPTAGQQWKIWSGALGLSGGAAAGAWGSFKLGLSAGIAAPLSYIYRGGVVVGRSLRGSSIGSHVDKLVAQGATPEAQLAQLDWLGNALSGKGAARWGINPADRPKYQTALDTLRTQVQGGQPLGADSVKVLRGATMASLLSPMSRAGQVNEALQLGTLGITTAYSLEWLAANGVHPSDPVAWARVLFTAGNVAMSSRLFADRLAIVGGIQGLASTPIMKNYMNAVHALWAGSAPPWVYADAVRGTVASVPESLSVAAFGLAAGFNCYRGVKALQGQPVQWRIDPSLVLGTAIGTRFALSMTPWDRQRPSSAQEQPPVPAVHTAAPAQVDREAGSEPTPRLFPFTPAPERPAWRPPLMLAPAEPADALH